MKKNTNNEREKEKLKEVTSSNFVQLDESLTENKDSKVFESEKGKLDFDVVLNKNDDIVIEDNNNNKKEYNKKDKSKNDLKTNKIQIENKFDKKSNQNINKNKNNNNINDQIIGFNKINKENFNNISDLHLNNKNIELNVQQDNKAFYNTNEIMKNEKQQVRSPEKAKNKLELSFNNMIYDTLDEPVWDTIVS